eukprot:m.1317491 g.1317491  ORF g.1317491 m.1317491 type:complete len:820 (+) comp24840_c0_seq35:130-2589(+)
MMELRYSFLYPSHARQRIFFALIGVLSMLFRGSMCTTANLLQKQYGEIVSPSYKVQQGIDIDACQKLCTGDAKCIALSFREESLSCSLSTWDPHFTVNKITGNRTASFYQQKSLGEASHQPIKPAVEYPMSPILTGVTLHNNTIFANFFKANLAYLESFIVDDMLYWFRDRAGIPQPPHAASWGWDNGGPDKPYGLRGSVAGAYLMGAGGALRYGVADNGTVAVALARVQQTVTAIVDGIAAAQDPTTGYAMGFPMNESTYHENPDYVTSWVTHGLLEAATSGNDKALTVLRRHFDWFNHATTKLPFFLPPRGGNEGVGSDHGPFPCVKNRHPNKETCSTDDVAFDTPQMDNGHLVYLIYQGIIHNTRVALSPVGVQEDYKIAQSRYAEDWWLEQLAARNSSAIWLRSFYPHNYEITAIEAYMDLYQITGEERYVNAVDGFYDMFREDFMHLGGTVAIKEWKLYPPGSYYLDTTGEDAHGTQQGHNNCSWQGDYFDGIHNKNCWHSTGELCGQAFWIKLSVRLLQLRPTTELYAAEIERALLNGVVSQIPPDGHGIRQFAVLHKVKMVASNISTCCEGQGTRILGSFPELIYSVPTQADRDAAPADVSINMYVGSTLAPAGTGFGLTISTFWPYDDKATIRITSVPSASRGRIGLRIPRWLDANTSEVVVESRGQGRKAYEGLRGTYLVLTRSWAVGDIVTVPLVASPHVHRYTGLTQIAGYQRYAITVGPVLLAAVLVPGSISASGVQWNTTLDTIVLRGISDPTAAPMSWLVPQNSTGSPSAATSMVYAVRGNAGVVFKPYHTVQEETFDVYCVFVA